MLTLSQRERDRLSVLRQVDEEKLTVAEGARRTGRSLRQMRRLLRRFEQEGDAVVIHGLRGRASNHRLPGAVRQAALEKARQELYRDFGPTLLSEHLGRDPEVGGVNPATLRLWMIQDGHWKPRKRKERHRSRRERRRGWGELVLMDTSIHDWLEGRSPEAIVLIALIDDATSRLHCRFFPRDTGRANRTLLIGYMQRFGRMGAVYADRAGHFQAHFNRKQRREADQQESLTLIERGLNALDIELIHALSPQAKGRVERLFGTLQDRLIKEMRVAGIDSLAEANRFLEEIFIPFWSERFTLEPAEPVDAHRALPARVDLLRLFAETEERVIRNDFTFCYRKQHYQIGRKQVGALQPRSKITIERRVDGSMKFRWREKYLQPTPLAAAPQTPKPEPEPRPKQPPRVRPPAADHPWRRFPLLVGQRAGTT